MPEAARVGDSIGHAPALAGMIAGTVAGGLIAAVGSIAAGTLVVAGLGASCLGVGLLAVGAGLALGHLSGELATATRDALAGAGAASMGATGALLSGSLNVFINGRPAALATLSPAGCIKDGPTMAVAEGSSKVYINGFPAARSGDKIICGAQVMSGSDNVIIGGAAEPILPVTPEVPSWAYQASDLTLLFAGLAGGVAGLAGRAGKLSQLPGIGKLSQIACRAGVLLTGVQAAGIIARPVDIVSGQKFLSGEEELDFVLPSRLAVRWQRYWRSGNPAESVLGRGWSLFWETRLMAYQEGVVWRSPAGDYVSFPLVPPGHRCWCEAQKQWLEHHPQGEWSVYGIDGERWHFGALNTEGVSLPARLSSPCGNDLLFQWHTDQSLASLTDSAGRRVVCRYREVAGQHRLSGAWLDDDVCLVSYEYDEQGQLITVRGRGSRIQRHFGWHDGLMIRHEDRHGLVCEYRWQEYEGIPRVVAYRNSAGEALTMDYGFTEGARQVRREDGAVARWLVDDDETVACFTDFDGRRVHLLYERGELTGAILPGGGIQRSTWDNYGRMLSETDPEERVTRYEWHRMTGQLSRIIYPDGSTERMSYDDFQRLSSETDALNQTTRYHYPDDEEPLPDSITDARGAVRQFVYNRQGLLTRHTDCSGNVTRYDYDRFGQLTGSEDAEGHLTRRQYNAYGELITVTGPDGRQMSIGYNAHGQPSRVTDPTEAQTELSYNVLGQLQSITDRIQRTRHYRYDPRGRLLAVDNGNGSGWSFGYDAAGRVTEECRPDGSRRRWIYAEQGLAASVESIGAEAADGGFSRRVVHYDYDKSGLPVSRTHTQYRVIYHYDANGRLTQLHRQPMPGSVVSEDRVSFSYDAAGRRVSETGCSGTLHYDYDVLYNLTGLTLPEGQQIQWLHDGSGHVSGVKFNQQIVSEFSRDRLHRETARTAGARSITRRYDSSGRRVVLESVVPSLPESTLLSRVYHYSQCDELLSTADSLRGDTLWQYDAEGRLRGQSGRGTTGYRQAFCYDPADNLAEESDHQTGARCGDDRLSVWRGMEYDYDSRGNTVRRRDGCREQHYTYDDEDRLLSAKGSGPQGTFEAYYEYDVLGRRIRKRVITSQGTKETRFLWQGYRLLQERSIYGECRTYIYDPDEAYSPLARADHLHTDTDHSKLYWFSTDPNGAPLEVTDQSGAVCWSGNYESFGRVELQSDGYYRFLTPPPHTSQPLRYAGQYADEETGLHYNLFRYYDPQCGRFTTPDPISFAGGLNLYQYAPNPHSWMDPWGLSGWQIDGDRTTSVLQGGPFKEKYYKDGQSGLWWSKDTTGHGGSAFKVYRETPTSLEWIADTDKNGQFIPDKHKGSTGKIIPKKAMKKCGL